MTCERRRPAGRAGRAVEGVGDATPVIDNDHVAATRQILDHLAAEGARNIALTA
ncbi:hypothetical protein ACQ86D_20650 [Streptomyces galilaeus]